jgi:flagellin
LTSANQQLGSVQGLLETTQSGLNDVSNTMASMRDVLVKLSDNSLTSTQQADYQAQYGQLLANVKSFITDATYNGKSLIGNIGSGTNSSVAVPIDESGSTYSTYGIAAIDGSSLYHAISISSATLGAATSVLAELTATGGFITQMNNVGTYLNTIGSSINYVNNQTAYNNDKVDALNSGLGSLVDADLAKESAQLTALQIRQQLGTQALSLANQAPQSLLSLFK